MIKLAQGLFGKNTDLIKLIRVIYEECERNTWHVLSSKYYSVSVQSVGSFSDKLISTFIAKFIDNTTLSNQLGIHVNRYQNFVDKSVKRRIYMVHFYRFGTKWNKLDKVDYAERYTRLTELSAKVYLKHTPYGKLLREAIINNGIKVNNDNNSGKQKPCLPSSTLSSSSESVSKNKLDKVKYSNGFSRLRDISAKVKLKHTPYGKVLRKAIINNGIKVNNNNNNSGKQNPCLPSSTPSSSSESVSEECLSEPESELLSGIEEAPRTLQNGWARRRLETPTPRNNRKTPPTKFITRKNFDTFHNKIVDVLRIVFKSVSYQGSTYKSQTQIREIITSIVAK